MRKIIMTFVFLLIFGVMLSAEDGSPDVVFNIKAYKLGQVAAGEYFELKVTDALNGSLSVIHDPEKDESGNPLRDDVDITDYINNYLGTLPTDTGSGDGTVLYSYRLAGNGPGKYQITMSISEFTGENNAQSIDAFYEISNENIIFNHSSKTESDDGFSITQIETGSKYGSTVSTQPVILITQIEISAPSDKTLSDDIWIARGAVSAIIDQAGYANAPNDRYVSAVTISVAPV